MLQLKIARAVIALLLLVSASCTVGPDYQRPSTTVAPAWLELQPAGFDVQPATLTQWWAEFNDPTLNSIVERAVKKPREIEVSVLGNENPRASCPGEIVPHREFYDYTAKYLEEGTGLIAPAGLDEATSERLRDYAVRTFRALDCCGMGRVD